MVVDRPGKRLERVKVTPAEARPVVQRVASEYTHCSEHGDVGEGHSVCPYCGEQLKES